MSAIFCECGDELNEHDWGGCNLCKCNNKPSQVMAPILAVLNARIKELSTPHMAEIAADNVKLKARVATLEKLLDIFMLPDGNNQSAILKKDAMNKYAALRGK